MIEWSWRKTYTSVVGWWQEEPGWCWWWWWWWFWLSWRVDPRGGSLQCGEPGAVDSSSRGRGRTGLVVTSTRTRFLGFCLSPEPAHEDSRETFRPAGKGFKSWVSNPATNQSYMCRTDLVSSMDRVIICGREGGAEVVIASCQGSFTLKRTLIYHLFYSTWDHNLQNKHHDVSKTA